MTGEIMKIEKKKAKDGGSFWYIFFKMKETGKSARSCIYERMRNFAKWEDIIKNNKFGLVLSNLIMLEGNLIDADSDFKILKADVPKVDPVPDRPKEANVATNICDLCGKYVNNKNLCHLKVNIGEIEDTDGKIIDDIPLSIHSACRDQLYEKIGTGTAVERKRIDADLIAKAKAQAGL